MHLLEGVLSSEMVIGSILLSSPFLYMAYKKTEFEDIPKVAIFSSLFFIGSFIHVPFGPTNLHLVLNGLIGVFLGIRAFLAIFVALFFQALIFGYGGITTLGANLFIMAFPALISFYIYLLSAKGSFFIKRAAFFTVGFMGVFLSSLLLSLFLFFSNESFKEVAKISFLTNLPIMIIEGFITLFAIEFILKSHPELLEAK